ncbi:MAG: alpha amylase C-terminal domain-containing protein, partial [Butyricicoccaceae bacterium]
IQASEPRRRELADKLDCSLQHMFQESFVLPFSHDDVGSNGGQPLIERISGGYEQKFAGLRTLLGFQIACPGKNLLFMGCEFGQFSPWSAEKELDWKLLDYDTHKRMQRYAHDLNLFYLCTHELWETDSDPASLMQIDIAGPESGLLAFRRVARHGGGIVVVINFSPYRYQHCQVGVLKSGIYEEVFNSDRVEYGGHGVLNGKIQTEPVPAHGCEQSVELNISPQTVIFLRGKERKRRR